MSRVADVGLKKFRLMIGDAALSYLYESGETHDAGTAGGHGAWVCQTEVVPRGLLL